MANLKDLQNRLQTIAEAEKNGGILDIPTEAIQILAMCNSIRIEMINEMCEGIDPEQCDEQLFIQLVSARTRTKEYNPEFDEVECHYYELEQGLEDNTEICHLGLEIECCNHCYMNRALYVR